jgi:hypothetical protein
MYLTETGRDLRIAQAARTAAQCFTQDGSLERIAAVFDRILRVAER